MLRCKLHRCMGRQVSLFWTDVGASIVAHFDPFYCIGMSAENPFESLLHASPLLCDGTEFQMHQTGTWKGHFLPGLIFLSWGIWWTVRAFRSFHTSRLEGLQYYSRAWWSGCWSAEPLLKIFGPPIGILIELWLDHDQLM